MLTRVSMVTKKNLTGCALISLLVLLSAGCRPRDQRAFQNGVNLLDRGRYSEAAEELTLAASLVGTNAQIWNYLGVAWHQAGQFSNAVVAYQKALALDRDLTEAHFNLGCLWLEANHLDAAKSELMAFTLRRGNSAEGFARLGTVQLRSRDLAAAEKSFTEALNISPHCVEAINGLGLIQLQRNRPRDAAQFFNNALKQQANYAPALLNLAVVSQVHLNNRPAALEKYREYLALPGTVPNREEITAVVHSLEQELEPPPRPAPTNNTSRIAARPPDSRSISNEASHVAVLKTEPATNAARLPLTAAAASPPAVKSGTVTAPPSMTRTQVVSGATTGMAAKENSEQHVASNRTSPPSPQRVEAPKAAAVKTPVANGPAVEAPAGTTIPRYRYLSPSTPSSGDHEAAETVFNQGAQAQKASRFSEAIQSYRRAVQLDPAYYEAYYNLGIAGAEVRNWPQALAAYESALAIRRDSLDARCNFALALKQAGYLVDSAAEFERLLVLYPDEPRAHLALGNLYAKELQQPNKAREHYQKVLQVDPGNAQAPNIRYWLSVKRP